MYEASQAFHDAVANREHQIALLIFDDAVFTNDDIDVSEGIEFNDYFNTEEDITVGQALSNEISFSVFNDDGLLDDYEFGKFTATIGAQIGMDTYGGNPIVYTESAEHTYAAFSSLPYLRRDAVAISIQPQAKVVTMLYYNGIVYCLLENGTVKAYNDADGTVTSVTLNSFMLSQLNKWEGEGIAYTDDRILKIFMDNECRTYEFVPLGVFEAERPNVPTVNLIHFTCYDMMQRFDKDLPSAGELQITYPTTVSNLYVKMCNYLDVPYKSSTFSNSTAVITKQPEEFENTTFREVLQWIAELAGSIARFNRDGELVMDWLRYTDLTIDEGGYKEFNPYWYETKKVTRLLNRTSDGEFQYYYGVGDETYLIQDNPLLRGVT
jgi:hypothetical protein